MLGKKFDAVVELERQILEQEPRVRGGKRKGDRKVVGRGHRFQILLHVGAIRQLQVCHEKVEGELNILGGESDPVTPLCARADVHREAGEVFSVGIAGCQPRDHFIAERRIIEQAFPESSVADLMGCTSRVRVPNACVGETATTTTTNDLQRPVARYVGDSGLGRHGSGV